jgi:hypothetical protein
MQARLTFLALEGEADHVFNLDCEIDFPLL